MNPVRRSTRAAATQANERLKAQALAGVYGSSTANQGGKEVLDDEEKVLLIPAPPDNVAGSDESSIGSQDQNLRLQEQPRPQPQPQHQQRHGRPRRHYHPPRVVPLQPVRPRQQLRGNTKTNTNTVKETIISLAICCLGVYPIISFVTSTAPSFPIPIPIPLEANPKDNSSTIITSQRCAHMPHDLATRESLARSCHIHAKLAAHYMQVTTVTAPSAFANDMPDSGPCDKPVLYTSEDWFASLANFSAPTASLYHLLHLQPSSSPTVALPSRLTVLNRTRDLVLRLDLARHGHSHSSCSSRINQEEEEEEEEGNTAVDELLTHIILVAAGLLTDEVERRAYDAWITPAIRRACALEEEEEGEAAAAASSTRSVAPWWRLMRGGGGSLSSSSSSSRAPPRPPSSAGPGPGPGPHPTRRRVEERAKMREEAEAGAPVGWVALCDAVQVETETGGDKCLG
ncbi:hypothetical protein F4859DRAFT_526190 [Xylaria cf. heliscus]|nr:hypothetical protein F4859DRAFT_526190 [Xylaria cf. heliscus]